MKKFKTIIAVIGAPVLLFSCGNGGNGGSSGLKLVKIGAQTWTTKNLDVSSFRNGEAIPEARTKTEWEKAGKEGNPAWCYYENDPANGTKYGKLYNWYAVNDPRGLAPKGWHIPGDEEWTTLTDHLGGDGSGNQMKSSSGWKDNGNGSNSSGFAGLPGGSRYDNGTFYTIGATGNWWSSSENDTGIAWGRGLGYDGGLVHRFKFTKQAGMSVRCLVD